MLLLFLHFLPPPPPLARLLIIHFLICFYFSLHCAAHFRRLPTPAYAVYAAKMTQAKPLSQRARQRVQRSACARDAMRRCRCAQRERHAASVPPILYRFSPPLFQFSPAAPSLRYFAIFSLDDIFDVITATPLITPLFAIRRADAPRR